MSGLPSQLVTIPFSGGLSQKTDVWQIEPGKQTSLINGEFVKGGQIRKRLGNVALSNATSTGGSITTGKRVMFRSSEQLVTDGDSLYSYSPTLGSSVLVDQVPQPIVTRASVFNGETNFSDPDVAIGSGYEVYAWKSGDAGVAGDIYASIIDPSGTPILTNKKLTAGASSLAPHAFVIGTTAIIAFCDITAGTISACTVSLASAPTAWSAPTVLKSDMVVGASVAFDACQVGAYLVIAYEMAAGVNRIRLQRFNTALVSQALDVVTNELNTGFTAIGVMGTSGEGLYVAYSYSAGGFGTTRCAGANSSTMAQTFAPAVLYTSADAGATAYAIGLCRYSATLAVVVIQTLTSSNTREPVISTFINSAGAVGTVRKQNGIVLVGKPFTYSSRVYAQAMSFPSATDQGTTFIVDLQIAEAVVIGGFRVVATVAPRVTNNASTNLLRTIGSLCSSPQTTIAGVFVACGTIIRSADVKGLLGLVRLNIDFIDNNRFTPAELGENLHLTGGTPLAYDGRSAFEIGFFQYVNGGSVTANVNNAGGGLAAAIYRYVFVLRYTDARGQVHRSAPSDVVVVDHSGSGTVTNRSLFTLIPHAYLTSRQDDGNGGLPAISLDVYRTARIAGVMSTVFYLISPDNTLAALANVATGTPTTFTFTDTGTGNFADSVIASNPLVYTTGGVLANVCPPSASLACVHKQRLWLGGADDPTVIWYSKTFTPGEAVAFCDEFTIGIPDAGAVTAIASMDDKLIVFKRTGIYVIVGDGPPDTLAGDDLSTPQRVASDVGCTNARSVVLTPRGLMFQSDEGLMLLSRGLEVSYIGHPVEDSLSLNPTITSAVLVGAKNQVRFTCISAADATLGISLVYDYVQDIWTTYSYTTAAGPGGAVASAALSPSGVYTWLTPAGVTYQERTGSDGSAYRDGTAWVTLTIESAWFGRPALFQRIRKISVFGNGLTNFDLNIGIAVDRSLSYTQTRLWRSQVSGVATRALGSPMQITERIGSQGGMTPRCESIRVKISDASPTNSGGSPPAVTTGQGATFTAIALEVAQKTGIKRLPAGAKV